MKLLLTGFEPFNNSPVNPSQLLLSCIGSINIHDCILKTCLLPVDTIQAPKILIEHLVLENPDVVVCLGQAFGRTAFSIERLAINLLNFDIPDNRGMMFNEQPIIPGAPTAYFATLPLTAIKQEVNKAGIPCELSLSAGTYLCNQVFYVLMHTISKNDLSVKGGFIHLPALPEQIACNQKIIPSMSLEDMFKALRVIIDVILAQYS